MHVTYLDGRGVLRDAIASCAAAGFAVSDITTRQLVAASGEEPGTVTVTLALLGSGSTEELAAGLAAHDGVLAVNVESDDAE